MIRRFATLCCWVVCLAASRRAHAQSGTFYLDRAQLSGAPDDGFMVWRPYMFQKTRFYASGALGYSHNPLRSDTVTADPTAQSRISNPVQGQFITYLMAGTQVVGHLSANIALPITVLQLTGDDPAGQGVGTGGIADNKAAFHDLRLDARVQVFESNDRLLRLGGGFALWLPTGNNSAFAGDGQVTGYMYGAAEFDFKRFLLSGTIGLHGRPDLSIGGANGALFVGSEARWAFGAYLPLRDGKVRLGGELWGTTGIASPAGHTTFFALRNTDFEWLAQARFFVDPRDLVYAMAGFGTRLAAGYGGPDVRMLGMVGTYLTLFDVEPHSPPRKAKIVPTIADYDLDSDGDGYPDAVDKCPTVKEDGKPPLPSDGCPGVSDRDGDGIPDSQDQCPDKAEDKDGIQDDDGCPEKDVDNDGIPDTEDKCPLQPGPRSSNPAKNGCPQLTEVSPEGEVHLLKPIEFETGKAVIKPDSYPILDEVVTLLKSRSGLRLGVYGHTDDRGIPQGNMLLSRDRAASVVKYLIDKGISASRLESAGFGQTKPIADNATEAGRAQNRRVEFKLLSGAN